MLFLARRLRFGAWFRRNNKITAAFLQSSHNLKIASTINAEFGTRAEIELSVSKVSLKKCIKIVIDEFERSKKIDTNLISEQAYGEVARLLETRTLVEESKKSLEDLVRQDPEMKKLGEEEYSSYEKELEILDEKLIDSIFRSVGRENCRDIILEITTGVGGQEAMLFAKNLLDMYLGYIDYLAFQHEIIHQDAIASIGGIRHVSIAISGEKALEMFRHEGGVHRVQRIPATEKSGRIHTSTVSVAILPQPSEIEVNLKDKDLRIETKKASGAGGQHVNTTDSAVRIVHLPTGLSVESQTDRSQIKNRQIAMLRLRTLIYEKQINEQRENSSEMRKKQIGLGNRNEKVRTYNFNQDRITDHRIADGTSHNLKGFLQGGEDLRELQRKLQIDLQMKILREIIEKIVK